MPEMLSREQLEALKGHTQGPWEVFPKLKYNEWHVSVPMEGAQMRLGLFADGVPGNNPEPDARLIAAAPDLLNTALAALARAEAAEARVRDLERVLRNASATLGWYAYSGNYKTNYAPDGDPGKSDVMRDAGSRARGERASVLAVLAQAGSAQDGLRAYGEEGE